MKTLDFKGPVVEVAVAAGKAVRRAAASVVNALTEVRPGKPRSRDAAAELRRRAEINAQGAARRRDLESAVFGRASGAWIQPRPDWLQGRR